MLGVCSKLGSRNTQTIFCCKVDRGDLSVICRRSLRSLRSHKRRWFRVVIAERPQTPDPSGTPVRETVLDNRIDRAAQIMSCSLLKKWEMSLDSYKKSTMISVADNDLQNSRNMILQRFKWATESPVTKAVVEIDRRNNVLSRPAFRLKNT